MPKKNKPNGYLLFMQEFRQREERRGRRFKGLQEVQADPQCNKEWKEMSNEKRIEYNNRAKRAVRPEGKKTGIGESMDAVSREQKRKQQFLLNMKDEIESTVALAMELGNLPTMKFNFIHCNWFYRRPLENNQYDYIPAEFAVSEFSLRDGVTNIYHQILKAEIETGYTREAMETSHETHKLSWNLEFGESRFEVMAENLKEFLKPGMKEKKYPPLYASTKIKPAVQALIRRFSEKLDVPEDTFLIYDLELLFTYLRNAASLTGTETVFFHTVMAEYELIKDTFSFTPGLDCNFHKNLDGTSQYCSLSHVKRWAFTICDYCCESLNIKMIPGVHLPVKYNYEEAITMNNSTNALSKKMDEMQLENMISIKSMTGVSKEYRTRVSERTDADEQKRRRDKTTITVVKYGEIVSASTSAAKVEPKPEPQEYQRPLRRPTSLSHALIAGKSKAAEEHSYNESEFPSLGVSVGRGHSTRKKNNESRSGTGRGRGIALS